jgi:hypothetical protein
MTETAVGCATLLGVLFGSAVFAKLPGKRFRGFAASSGLLTILPAATRHAAAVVTVVTEVVITVTTAAFVLTRTPWLGLAGFGVATALLAVFSVAIGIALKRGDHRPCRCFGVTAAPLGPIHLYRNSAMIVAAIVGAAASGSTAIAPAGLLIAVFTGCCGAAIAIRLDDIAAVFRPLAKG